MLLTLEMGGIKQSFNPGSSEVKESIPLDLVLYRIYNFKYYVYLSEPYFTAAEV